jgi:hypothetical protein
VIDETMAERMVACGWIAAAAAGLFLLVLAFVAGLRFGWLNLLGGAALLALAYGIYRRSRTCAVIVLINHVLGISALLRVTQFVPPIEIAATLVLAALYVLAIIGTFVHHARRRPATA